MGSWIFSGDHKFIIKDPQIFIAGHKSFSSETLRISLDTLSFSLEIPTSSVEDICIGYPMRSDINLGGLQLNAKVLQGKSGELQ